MIFGLFLSFIGFKWWYVKCSTITSPCHIIRWYFINSFSLHVMRKFKRNEYQIQSRYHGISVMLWWLWIWNGSLFSKKNRIKHVKWLQTCIYCVAIEKLHRECYFFFSILKSNFITLHRNQSSNAICYSIIN